MHCCHLRLAPPPPRAAAACLDLGATARRRRAKLAAFDPEHDEPLGKPVERSGELDRLGKAERMGRRAKELARQLTLPERRAGGPCRAQRLSDRVDDPDGVARSSQASSNCTSSPSHSTHVDVGQRLAQQARGDRPGGVVAPPGVADADDTQARYDRCTSSVRKCVAHEMHGS